MQEVMVEFAYRGLNRRVVCKRAIQQEKALVVSILSVLLVHEHGICYIHVWCFVHTPSKKDWDSPTASQ